MKKIKVNSKVQIILITITLITMSIIIINKVIGEKTYATSVPYCPGGQQGCAGTGSTETIITYASCFTNGKKRVTCTTCGRSQEVTILAPNSHSYGDWTIDTYANCVKTGTKHKTCFTCGDVKTETIPALGGQHSYGNWNTTKSATCQTKGEQTRKCSVCNNIETRRTALVDHISDGTVTSNNNGTHSEKCIWCSTICGTTNCSYGKEEVKYTTCTEDGYTTQQCTKCGYVKRNDYPATGHVQGEWTITKEPTCVEEGEEKRNCIACGKNPETRNIPISLENHIRKFLCKNNQRT